MNVQHHVSALLLAATLSVGMPARITSASAGQAKDDIKDAAKSAKEAGKSVGHAGKNVGKATAEGAKQGAKTFKQSLTRRRGHSHQQRVPARAPRKGRTKSGKRVVPGH